MAPKAVALREPTLLVVDAGEQTHAVQSIYPSGQTKAQCGVVAGAERKRRTDVVSALTCADCKSWAGV